MTKSYLYIAVVFLSLIIFSSCTHSTLKNKIVGNWRSADGKTKLKITQKDFTLDEGEEPIAENYFVKGDSVFTSYEGSEPYTKFVIKNLSDKTLTLVYPDSTSVSFVR